MKRLAALTVCIVVALIGAWVAWAWLDEQPFDQARWNAQQGYSACTKSVRRQMVPDLKEHHLKRGLTRQQARALLGKPDFVSRDATGTYVEWLTGQSTLDCFTLQIRFINGRLVESMEGQT
jgi:hypothetical protein